eukprot:s6186_g12.t1
MAEIRAAIQIRYQEKSPILIPKELLKTANQKQFIQLRATSQPIIQLLTGKKPEKNSSLSKSSALQKLVKQRNDELQKPPEAAQQLFDDAPAPKKPAKKRKAAPGDQSEEVEIQVQATKVVCLMTGKRPRKTDLTIELQEDQVTAIISSIREEDVEEVLQQARRGYHKRARQ